MKTSEEIYDIENSKINKDNQEGVNPLVVGHHKDKLDEIAARYQKEDKQRYKHKTHQNIFLW